MFKSNVFLREYFIYPFVFLLSFFFSFLTLYHYPIFNPDGGLYLQAAGVFLSHGLHASMKVYSWPLYSVLIGSVSKLTTLTLLNAAYLINFVFSALTACLFVRIVKEIGGSKKFLWLAVLVFFAFHSFNGYRADIIRGHGYWFFFLLSILCLLRFAKTQSCLSAFFWSIAILVATLFRIEGGIYLILTPFVAFFFKTSWKDRMVCFVKLNVLIILLVLLLLLLSFFSLQHLSDHLGRVNELFFQIRNGLFLSWGRIVSHNVLLKTQVLGKLGQDDSSVFLFFGMAGTYLYNVLSSFSLAYCLILLYNSQLCITQQ